MTATCIHCHQTFTRRLVMAVGLSDQEKMGDLGQVCGQHLQLVHPDQMQEIGELVAIMSGLALGSNFKCSEPLWKVEMNRATKRIGKLCGRVLLDDDIVRIVRKQLDGRAEDSFEPDEVIALLRQQRDYLTFQDFDVRNQEPTA